MIGYSAPLEALMAPLSQVCQAPLYLTSSSVDEPRYVLNLLYQARGINFLLTFHILPLRRNNMHCERHGLTCNDKNGQLWGT
ncbi:hypothetical protein A0H81_04644 [Grifola frondosa]|uniref:Uncharacterized protein n=1 Tax=Grifola frondosa TaxID=5627 RepID=A0A1C7MFN3_GRIFR|nr:hypothetical protein A0H81_04644 [Grifola frondosa]